MTIEAALSKFARACQGWTRIVWKKIGTEAQSPTKVELILSSFTLLDALQNYKRRERGRCPSGIARKRHYHRTESGRVANFVVQLEVEVKGEWRPVIRYDSSHEFVHRDCYNLKGKQKKKRLI